MSWEIKCIGKRRGKLLSGAVAVTAVFGLRIYQQGSDLAAVREPFAFLPPTETRLLRTPA